MYLFNSQQESKCISLDVKLDLTIEYRTLANSSGTLHLCYWGQNFSYHSLHGQYFFYFFFFGTKCMHVSPHTLSADSCVFGFGFVVCSEVLKKGSSVHLTLLKREVEAVRDKQRSPVCCDRLLQHISSLPTETAAECPEWHGVCSSIQRPFSA